MSPRLSSSGANCIAAALLGCAFMQPVAGATDDPTCADGAEGGAIAAKVVQLSAWTGKPNSLSFACAELRVHTANSSYTRTLLHHPVAQYTVVMALASGLGALPFFFVRPDKMSRTMIGAASAVASGVTLAASFGMIYEGVRPYPISTAKPTTG